MVFIPLIVYALTLVMVLRIGFGAFTDMEDGTKEYDAPSFRKDMESALIQVHLLRAIALYARSAAQLLAASFVGGIGVVLAAVLTQFIR